MLQPISSIQVGALLAVCLKTAAGFQKKEWKSFVAAPLPIPADAKTVFVNEGLRYELKSYSAKTVKLTAPETGVYTGEVAVPSTFVDEGVTDKSVHGGVVWHQMRITF